MPQVACEKSQTPTPGVDGVEERLLLGFEHAQTHGEKSPLQSRGKFSLLGLCFVLFKSLKSCLSPTPTPNFRLVSLEKDNLVYRPTTAVLTRPDPAPNVWNHAVSRGPVGGRPEPPARPLF